jgi:L-malate glycosyltransferase
MPDVPRKLVIVTNLYPTEQRPYFGTFVRNFHEDLVGRAWVTNLFALPQFGSGVVGYLRFYLNVFFFLVKNGGLVYVHYVSHSALPVVAARFLNKRIKVVCHYHGSDAFPESNEGVVRRWLKAAVCKVANRVSNVLVVPTGVFKDRLVEAYRPKSPVFVSPSGGVNESIFFSSNKNNDALKICFAGRMIPGKGAPVSARLMGRLTSSISNVQGVLAGDGEERAEVEAILEKFSGKKIEVLPAMGQCELADLFRSSSIFLFPSTRAGESLGLTWVEAALCGALPLVLKNGVTESLVPQAFRDELVANNEEDLYQKLHALALDRDRRELIVESLKEYLSLQYGSEKVGEMLSDMLCELT